VRQLGDRTSIKDSAAESELLFRSSVPKLNFRNEVIQAEATCARALGIWVAIAGEHLISDLGLDKKSEGRSRIMNLATIRKA
jgi:hypothetical protein